MATITGIATSNTDFSLLVDVLSFIDANLTGSALVATLDDATQDLTVFAPNNAAFALLAADLGYTGSATDTGAIGSFLTANVDVGTLDAIIKYHVSGGAQSASDITAAGTVATLQGGTIGAGDLPTLVDAEPDLLDPSLVTTDVAADNGVVHIIDRVLLPVDLPGNDAPTLAGLVAASGTFDTNGADFDLLLGAVSAAGLVDTLNSDTVDLTVFAPNDDAFMGVAAQLGYSGTSEAEALGFLVDGLTLLSEGNSPIPLLTTILQYHLLDGSLQSSQVLAQTSFTTLAGATIDRMGTALGDLDPDLPDPELIGLDLLASNGIIHTINSVLFPADILQSDGSNDVDFVVGSDTVQDIVHLGDDNDYVDGKGRSDKLFTGAGDDVVLGGSGSDTIRAGSGDDVVKGGTGNENIRGGLGNDFINGNEGVDFINAGQGNDTALGGFGNDRIFTASGDDFAVGGQGNDRIWGGTGNDTIAVSDGRDTLTGGAGDDVFVFTDNHTTDRIIRFEAGEDLLDVSAYGLTGAQALNAVSDTGQGALLDLGTAQALLIGVAKADLGTDDFIL